MGPIYSWILYSVSGHAFKYFNGQVERLTLQQPSITHDFLALRPHYCRSTIQKALINFEFHHNIINCFIFYANRPALVFCPNFNDKFKSILDVVYWWVFGVTNEEYNIYLPISESYLIVQCNNKRYSDTFNI